MRGFHGNGARDHFHPSKRRNSADFFSIRIFIQSTPKKVFVLLLAVWSNEARVGTYIHTHTYKMNMTAKREERRESVYPHTVHPPKKKKRKKNMRRRGKNADGGLWKKIALPPSPPIVRCAEHGFCCCCITAESAVLSDISFAFCHTFQPRVRYSPALYNASFFFGHDEFFFICIILYRGGKQSVFSLFRLLISAPGAHSHIHACRIYVYSNDENMDAHFSWRRQFRCANELEFPSFSHLRFLSFAE